MNTLFADGQIDFSFSYHQGEASRNILDGLFPDTVRTFVFDEGTIANTHFVAIPYNAKDTAAAMVVANFLLSPEAQLEKAMPEVWGDFPAISPDEPAASVAGKIYQPSQGQGDAWRCRAAGPSAAGTAEQHPDRAGKRLG